MTHTLKIIERELGAAIKSMAKGKALGHDGIPVEVFQQLWSMVGDDFHQMILKGFEQRRFHKEAITKGVIT